MQVCVGQLERQYMDNIPIIPSRWVHSLIQVRSYDPIMMTALNYVLSRHRFQVGDRIHLIENSAFVERSVFEFDTALGADNYKQVLDFRNAEMEA